MLVARINQKVSMRGAGFPLGGGEEKMSQSK
jgi:hypothetical protein